MSLPKFPNNDSIPSREEVINQILSSIAMEELGLSHIINAEGEKIQYALGTIPELANLIDPLTIDELLELNKSVHKTLDSTMMNQFILKEKLLNALSASVMQGPTGPEGPQGPARIAVDPEVIALEPEDHPTVENIGPDDQDVVLQFGIPRGATGATGPTGPTGTAGVTGIQGLAATISVEQPARSTYDDNPNVFNVGTPQDAVLRFEIPSGKTPHIDPVTGHWFIDTHDTGVPAQGPKGDTGAATTTIPFAISKQNLNLSTDAHGKPIFVAFSGFGSSYFDSTVYLMEGEWETGTITIRDNMNYGTAFVMPHDGILSKFHLLFSSGDLTFEESCIIRPFACLAISDHNELIYRILHDTITFTEPYEGSGLYPRHSVRRGSSTGMHVEVPEGSLVAIVAGIMADNATQDQSGTFSVSGGLYFE